MLSQNQLADQLRLQNRLNAVINPDWVAANYPWHRAILVEAAEAMDHYGWKWWKKQEPNVAQTKIELVDIWHFTLSMFLQFARGDVELAAKDLHGYLSAQPFDVAGTVQDKLGFLAASAGGAGQFNGPAFLSLMRDLELSWDELHTTYVAKNVLNLFRQAHGYKDGSYVKTWDGREDNEILAGIMEIDPQLTPTEVLNRLEAIYAVVVKPAEVV